MPTFDAPAEIVAQLTWWWDNLYWPRLRGLTDDEYLWEPVPSLSIRDGVVEQERTPFGERGPFTTIAWRMYHLIDGVFGLRLATHVDHTATSHDDFVAPAPPVNAADAMATMYWLYERWIDAVAARGAEGFAQPCGPAEHVFADYPFAALVLHINREVIHHGAEIMTMRDLYRARA